jgi:hypothetical protein
MCDNCDREAEEVATRTAIPLSIVKEVQDTFKALVIEEHEREALTDQEVAEAGMVALQGDEALDLLPFIFGPYPLIMVRLMPVPGRGDGAMSLAMHSQGIGRERTIEVLEAALLSAKHTESGGVTEGGIIVSPGVQHESED